MTNIVVQFLHTTAAYQAAVIQLMIGEANYTSQQLNLPDWEPIRGTNQLEVEVSPPPFGVSGGISTTNYSFYFNAGKLGGLHRSKRLQPPGKNWGRIEELTGYPSLVDTNGAYRLATQWLASLAVDLAELERRYPLRVRQIPARDTNAPPGEKRLQPTPLFQVAWGTNSPAAMSLDPIYVELRGDTKEVWDFSVRDRSLLRRPTLVLTNAAELLGPPPQPRKFVEDLVGGADAYRTIAEPAEARVSLIKVESQDGTQRLTVREGPKRLKRDEIMPFVTALLDFDSYAWTSQKLCSPEYGVRLEFVRAGETAEAFLCFECDILLFRFDGKERTENFDFAHNVLLKSVKRLWPRDKELAKVEENNDQVQNLWNALEKSLESYR